MTKILLEADTRGLEKKLIGLKTDPALVKKLLALGEPFKKACEVLGYNIDNKNGGNPILAFVLQDYVIQNLINTGDLNVSTFKAIYNAVAKQLVADSEFFKDNDYNIIYCKKLYKKTPKEIENYLILQSEILRPTAEVYTKQDQEKNRKIFLYIKDIKNNSNEEELNIIKRAAKINNPENSFVVPTVKTATKLNDIELAKEIYEKAGDAHIYRSTEDLDKIVVRLKNLESKFAAILLLCSSNTEATKEALNHPEFRELNQRQIANAFMILSQDAMIPRGQLRKDVAKLLIQKILATFDQQENKAQI